MVWCCGGVVVVWWSGVVVWCGDVGVAWWHGAFGGALPLSARLALGVPACLLVLLPLERELMIALYALLCFCDRTACKK